MLSLKVGIQKFSKLIEVGFMSVVCTYHRKGVFKNIFWCGCCSLLIFVAKKATKGTGLQFLCTQGTFQGGRVEDHRLMFTKHLHLPQSYIQAILQIYWLHDVFNPSHPNISMHIPHTVLYMFPNMLAWRICLTIKRFFSWLSFPFHLHSHDLNVWFRDDIEKRN